VNRVKKAQLPSTQDFFLIIYIFIYLFSGYCENEKPKNFFKNNLKIPDIFLLIFLHQNMGRFWLAALCLYKE